MSEFTAVETLSKKAENRIGLTVTDKELELMNQLAEKKGLSRAKLIRLAFLEYLKSQK